jgi:hypothetical protein
VVDGDCAFVDRRSAAGIADALWDRSKPSGLREDTARIANRPWV